MFFCFQQNLLVRFSVFFCDVSSNSVTFNPLCIVKRITPNARFTFSVNFCPSSRFAIIKHFNVCIDLSTTSFPVCILGSQYSISIIRFLQNCLYSLELNAPPLSDFIFSRIPYKLKRLVWKLITSFISEVVQVFTVGHLLNLSTAFRICTLPRTFLLCKNPVNSGLTLLTGFG